MRRLSRARFLFIPIIVHLLLGLVAAIWVVQTYTASRKLTFKAGAPSPNHATRAVEHRVQMAKKQNTMTAPPVKRIVSVGLSRITLPTLPAMPTSASAPAKMAGIDGATLAAMPGPMGAAASSAGGPVTAFGFREKKTGSLEGHFYDLKQTPSKTPTGIGDAPGSYERYNSVLRNFVQGGWNEGVLASYYKAPTVLYANQVYVPIGPSEEAPKTFSVQGQVKPNYWIVLYKGEVTAPRTATFRFIGRGDNTLLVRLRDKTVFDGSWPEGAILDFSAITDQNALGAARVPGWHLAGGKWFDVQAGQRLPMEILIGDSGGSFSDFLLIQEKGVTYQNRRDRTGLAYPIFQAIKSPLPMWVRTGQVVGQIQR